MSLGIFPSPGAAAFLDLCPTHERGEALLPYDHAVPFREVCPGQKTFLGHPIDPETPVQVTADYAAYLRHQRTMAADFAALQQQAALRMQIQRAKTGSEQ